MSDAGATGVVFYCLNNAQFPRDLAQEAVQLILDMFARSRDGQPAMDIRAAVTRGMGEDGTYYVAFNGQGWGKVFEALVIQRGAQFTVCETMPGGARPQLPLPQLEAAPAAPSPSLIDFSEALHALRADLFGPPLSEAAEEEPAGVAEPAPSGRAPRMTGQPVFYEVHEGLLLREQAIELGTIIINRWGADHEIRFGVSMVSGGIYFVGFGDSGWGGLYERLLTERGVGFIPRQQMPDGRVPTLPVQHPEPDMEPHPSRGPFPARPMPTPEPEQKRRRFRRRGGGRGRASNWGAALKNLGRNMGIDEARRPNERRRRD